MSRYLGPRARINRRLGDVVMENVGAIRRMERRPFPPGIHGQSRRKSTDYALGLREKQKVRYFYGLTARQLRNLFRKAKRMKGNTGENLMILLERRVDNVVRVAGFARTQAQARQFVSHGHWYRNARKIDVPSLLVKPGDVLQVRDRNKGLYEVFAQEENPVPSWLEVNRETRTIRVLGLPTLEDCSLARRVDLGKLVEFLSR